MASSSRRQQLVDRDGRRYEVVGQRPKAGELIIEPVADGVSASASSGGGPRRPPSGGQSSGTRPAAPSAGPPSSGGQRPAQPRRAAARPNAWEYILANPQLRTNCRERMLNVAVERGQIPVETRDVWRESWEADPTATLLQIDKRPADPAVAQANQRAATRRPARTSPPAGPGTPATGAAAGSAPSASTGAPSPARSSSSGQPAQPRRTSAQRGTPRATPVRLPNRDQALLAAIADGRLVESDLPAYRAGWNVDPIGTARALAEIPKGSATAATATIAAQRSGQQQRTGAAGQQRSGHASGPSTSTGALGRAGVRPTYLGHETRANSAGELCVLAPSGWLTVSAAQAAGVSAADLRTALAMRGAGGRIAQLYREGPR